MSTNEKLTYIRRLRESDDIASKHAPGSKLYTATLDTNQTLSRMSEKTQDVAYRRKIIMDALINSSETSLVQLDNILQGSDEDKSSRNSTHNSPPHSLSPSLKSPKFSPHWEDYDVMKHRWSYLRPQTNRLTNSASHVIPESSDSVVININIADGTRKQVNGRFNDFVNYEEVLSNSNHA